MIDYKFVSHKERDIVSGFYFECPNCSEQYFLPESEVEYLDKDPEDYVVATCEDCGENFAIGEEGGN